MLLTRTITATRSASVGARRAEARLPSASEFAVHLLTRHPRQDSHKYFPSARIARPTSSGLPTSFEFPNRNGLLGKKRITDGETLAARHHPTPGKMEQGR